MIRVVLEIALYIWSNSTQMCQVLLPYNYAITVLATLGDMGICLKLYLVMNVKDPATTKIVLKSFVLSSYGATLASLCALLFAHQYSYNQESNLLCLFTGVWRWVLGSCFALTLAANLIVFSLTIVNSFKFLPESPKQRAIVMATRLVIVSMIKWSVALFVTIDHNLNLNDFTAVTLDILVLQRGTLDALVYFWNMRTAERARDNVAFDYFLSVPELPPANLSITKVDWDNREQIGSGTYGDVYRCTHGKMGEHVAVKVVGMISELLPSAQEELKMEAYVMTRMQHPNIVTVHGVQEDPVEGRFAMIMEYCAGGSLETLLYRSKQTLSYGRLLQLAADAAAGMRYLHRHKIVHRDLKPANLLLTAVDRPSDPRQMYAGSLGVLKITDFGTSRLIKDMAVNNQRYESFMTTTSQGERSSRSNNGSAADLLGLDWSHPLLGEHRSGLSNRLSTDSGGPGARTRQGGSARGGFSGGSGVGERGKRWSIATSDLQTGLAGTPVYIAPEILRLNMANDGGSVPKSAYAPSSDVYAFGIVLWEMYTRRAPYSDEEDLAAGGAGGGGGVFEAIINGHRPAIPDDMPTEYKCILEECWHPNPKRRPWFCDLSPRLQTMATEVATIEQAGEERAARDERRRAIESQDADHGGSPSTGTYSTRTPSSPGLSLHEASRPTASTNLEGRGSSHITTLGSSRVTVLTDLDK